MSIYREIEEQEMKLKALHHQRDMDSRLGQVMTPGESNGCGPMRHGSEWVSDVVRYHQPGPDGLLKIGAIRLATENLLRCIIDNCPDSSDRSEAIRLARTAMMTANASIVLNGRA